MTTRSSSGNGSNRAEVIKPVTCNVNTGKDFNNYVFMIFKNMSDLCDKGHVTYV